MEESNLNEDDDCYACTTCSFPVEIYEINDSNYSITLKCLNPNKEEPTKIIPIDHYLKEMKKNTYLYIECSLCQKKQNEFQDKQFLYCIICDSVFCPDCKKNHLESNKKNHPDSNSESIIKNNRKNVRCLLHHKEKNIGFCFDCNTHICKECLRSRKHMMHRKNDLLLEEDVTDKIENVLINIIKIYEEKIKELKKENKKKKKELNNKKGETEKKIEENKEEDLNNVLKQELKIIEKEYEENALNYKNEINNYQNLILINKILKNTHDNYPENYYYNNNINNIINNYCKSENESIKNLLIENNLLNIKNETPLEEKNNDRKDGNVQLKDNNPNVNRNIVIDDKIKITMIYSIDKRNKGINILGKNFVSNNKNNCEMIINEKRYKINYFINYDDYGINKNDELLTVFLIGVNNITKACNMFYGCNFLKSLPDINKLDTTNITDINGMFNGCSSLKSLSDISNWNTKNITNMGYLFEGCSSLQYLPDISKWDTQNVTNMGCMFTNCKSLQSLPDISKWNIKNLRNKYLMFDGCSFSNIPAKFKK